MFSTRSNQSPPLQEAVLIPPTVRPEALVASGHEPECMMLAQNLLANLADVDDREAQMARKGIERYRDKQDRLTQAGAAAERDDFASVIRRSLLGVADKLQTMIDQGERKRGVKSKLLLKVKAIEPVTVAYLTLTSIFSSLVKDNDKIKVAVSVGATLEDEYNFHFIHHAQPKLWQRLVRFAEEKGSYRHKRNFVFNTAATEGVVREEWSVADRALLGSAMLDVLAEAGLIVLTTDKVGHHDTKTTVSLSEEVVGWLEEHRRKADAGSLPMITPVWSPSNDPPVDWHTPFGGGYKHLKYPLVKHGRADYKSADMSRVYAAINAMQRTGWRINPVMFALVELLWASGEEVGKLPRCVLQPIPEKLPQEDWEQMGPDERKGWRLQLRDIHDNNRQATSDLASISMVLAQARELKDEPAIYIPYQLDYRGRVYAVPLMNPQGPDYIRSLFEFAEGKPVGERGAMWLAIQVASLWDGEYNGKKLSKCSFQERFEWTEQNEEFLRAIDTDPVADTRWVGADKPFMFLRTVRDWVGFLDLGPDFVSHIPIALDGSCSGIQHYSALLRDPIGGASVNLLPSEEPADVYGDVAKAVLAEVEADEPGEARDFWLSFGITRKVVKKPVMTYGYSSREAGFTDWYEQEFVRPAFKKAGRQDATNPVARYLAKKTLAAVEKQLVAVAQGMEWLISCASLLAHEGKGIEWTAPSGFPVVQRYINAPSVRVETELGGERIRISIPGAEKSISKEKQKSAISPNHTHSLDAAHLVLTVLKAQDEYGVTNFALIHDSFGTLAADTDAMFSAVREAFVEMYEEHDPFSHLYESVSNALSEEGREKLPVPPAKGDLDLAAVHQSLYAFA